MFLYTMQPVVQPRLMLMLLRCPASYSIVNILRMLEHFQWHCIVFSFFDSRKLENGKIRNEIQNVLQFYRAVAHINA